MPINPLGSADEIQQAVLDYIENPERVAEYEKYLQSEIESINQKRETQVYTTAVSHRKNLINSYKVKKAKEMQQDPLGFDSSASILKFQQAFEDEMISWIEGMSPERAHLFKAENANMLNGMKITAIDDDRKQVIEKDKIAWEKDLLDFESTLEGGDIGAVSSKFSEVANQQVTGNSGGVIDNDTFKKRIETLESKRDEFLRDAVNFEIKKAESDGGPEYALSKIDQVIKSDIFNGMSLKDKTKIYTEQLRLRKKQSEGGGLSKEALDELKTNHEAIERDFFSGAPKTQFQDYLDASQKYEDALMAKSNASYKSADKKKYFAQSRAVALNRLSTEVALNNSKLMVSENWEDFGKAVLGKKPLYKDGVMTDQAKLVFKYYEEFRKRFNYFKGAKDQVDYLQWVQRTFAEAPQGVQAGMDKNLGVIQSSSVQKVGKFLKTIPKNLRGITAVAIKSDLEQLITEQHLRQTIFNTQNPSMTEDQKQMVFKAVDFFVQTNNLDGLEGYLDFLTENLASWEGLVKGTDKSPGLSASQEIFMGTLESMSNIRVEGLTRNAFNSFRFAMGSNEEKKMFADVFGRVEGLVGKWLLGQGGRFDGVSGSKDVLKNMLSHAISGYLLSTPGGHTLATSKGLKMGAILDFGGIQGMLDEIGDKQVRVRGHIVPKHLMDNPPKPGEEKSDDSGKRMLMLPTHLNNSLNMGVSALDRVRDRRVRDKFGVDYPETNPLVAKTFIGLILHLDGENFKGPQDIDNYRLNGQKVQKRDGDAWINLKRGDGEDFELSYDDLKRYADQIGGNPEDYWEGKINAIKSELKGKPGEMTAERLYDLLGVGALPELAGRVVTGIIKGFKKKNFNEEDIAKIGSELRDVVIEKDRGDWVFGGNLTDEAFQDVRELAGSDPVEKVYESRQSVNYGGPTWFKITKGSDFEKFATMAGIERHKKALVSTVKKGPKGGFKINWAIDGDSFDVDIAHSHPKVGNNLQVRLTGVDTPEFKLDKFNALKAKNFVQQAVDGADEINFVFMGLGAHGRIVGRLLLDGEDLSELLIKEGIGVRMEFDAKKRRK